MSEQNNIPKIDNEIFSHLEKKLQESALNFVAYLNANQMTPRRWFGPGFWIIPFEGNNLFGIHLYGFNSGNDSNGWVFWFFSGDYSGSADDELIKFTQDHAGHCVKCSDACERQGESLTIFGKEYTNMCYQFPVRIEDPDDETFDL